MSCHVVPELAWLLGDQSCNNIILGADHCIRRHGCAHWICPEWAQLKLDRRSVRSWCNMLGIVGHTWLAFQHHYYIVNREWIGVWEFRDILDHVLRGHRLVLQFFLVRRALRAELICHAPLVPILVSETLGIVAHCCNSRETRSSSDGQVRPEDLGSLSRRRAVDLECSLARFAYMLGRRVCA